MPALQLTRHSAGVLRIVEPDVLHPKALLLQRLSKMTHGAEHQNDFLRMVRNMAGFLHHLDQQDGVAFAIKPLQRGEIER